MRHAILCLCLLAAFAASGCKRTEDYLADLQDDYDRTARRLRPEIYDAGQLVHEAFAGISEQQSLTLSQMARAVAAGGYIVAMDREVVPLLQAQGVAVLAHLAVRYPIPPASEPFAYTDRAQVEELVAAQITALGEQQDRLGVPASIALLNNPDRAVVHRAHERLQEVTGRNFGCTAAPWENWWTRNGPSLRRVAADASEEPLRIISEARFTDPRSALTQASAVLNFIGLHVALFDLPDARPAAQRAVIRIARQVVVLGIDRGLRVGDPTLRGAAAQAAARVLDPALGPALYFALPRERDSIARSRIIEALAGYPGRETMLVLMSQLRDDDHTVNIHAQRALVAISGEDFGPDAQAWQLWWDQTGKSRWP